MAERTLILSDLHLGRRPARMNPEALRPLWAGMSHLIVNGDAAEIHEPRYARDAAELVLRLEDLCQADGVTLTLVAGNHDPGLTERRHVFLAGGRVLVMHGDAVHPPVPPWTHSVEVLCEAFDDVLSQLPVESHADLEVRLAAAHRAAHRKWEQTPVDTGLLGLLLRPWVGVKLLRYWRAYPPAAERMLRQCAPQAKCVVLGHTHHQGIWHINGATIINTGSYGFPGRPWGVVLEGAAIAVQRIVRHGRRYGFSVSPVARLEL